MSSLVQKTSYLIPEHSCLSLRATVNTADLSDGNYLNKNEYKINHLDFHFQKMFCPISVEIWWCYHLASEPKQAWWAVLKNHWFLIVFTLTHSDNSETIKAGCTCPFLKFVNSSEKEHTTTHKKRTHYFIYSLLTV